MSTVDTELEYGESSSVDVAKVKLQENAFTTTTDFLTGINASINGAISSLDPSTNVGAVYQSSILGAEANMVLQKGNFQNEDPVIYAGFGITINGKELGVDKLAFITDLTINQNEGTSSTCEFKVSDPNFYFIEDSLYIRDTPIQASITLLGDLSRKMYFDGYIAAIDIDFPSNGCPTLSVCCIDKTHEMTRVRYKRSWENVTSAQVVQQIAQEHGFSCFVEAEYPFPLQATIIQDDKTNIEFLEELASKELEMFECHLVTSNDGKTTLYYIIKGKIDKDSYTSLSYREATSEGGFEVVSFRPNINIETRQEETKSDGINHDTKNVESYTEQVEEPNDTVESSGGSSSSSSSSGSDRVNIAY